MRTTTRTGTTLTEERFNLENLTEDESKTELRFIPADILILKDSLRILDTFTCSNGTVASGVEGLRIVLKRYAYPCRLSDMIPRFGRSVTELSEICTEVTGFIYNTHGYLLRSLNQPWLAPTKLQQYANAVHNRGAALVNCWGVVDGTVRAISCPEQHQRIMFYGHKRIHAIKFQSLVAPNGLIANLHGPVVKKNKLFLFICFV